MDGLLSRAGLMTSPRALLALSLMLSVLTMNGGKGTLAYFTSSAVSQSMAFSSGEINISGSTVPQSAGISWSSTAGGTNCATLALDTSAQDTTAGAMVPGQFCVAKVTITNTTGVNGGNDAWMRIRLIRDTTENTTATQALNDRLKFYMSELADLSTQNSTCTTSGFAPASSIALAGSAAVGKSNSVISAGSPISTLTQGGKNIGKHPTTFAPADTSATNYFNTDPNAVTSLTAATGGLGLGYGAGGTIDESLMNTAGAYTVRNAFNIVGNDQVTNPRDSAGTALHGTSGYSTNGEASLAAGQSRFYCAAIFFPSDTGTGGLNSASGGTPPTTFTELNAYGDNVAKSGSVTYRLLVTAAQKAGRSTAS